LLSRTLYKGHILLDKVVKRLAYLGEVFNEAVIEIGKPDETSDFFEFRRWGPISDGLYFNRVHRNFPGADDQSKVVNVRLLEFALFGSEIEIMFFKMAKNFVNDLPIFIESGTPNEDV
jgi:hypothetical protein